MNYGVYILIELEFIVVKNLLVIISKTLHLLVIINSDK